MPRGPKGEKRPADVIGAAVLVGRIATGEITEMIADAGAAAPGKRGGQARAAKLSPQRRKAIAKMAAHKRWDK